METIDLIKENLRRSEDLVLGEANPLAEWEDLFDGAEVSGDTNRFPRFDVVLEAWRGVRAGTRANVESYVETDLDVSSAAAPEGLLGHPRNPSEVPTVRVGSLVHAPRPSG